MSYVYRHIRLDTNEVFYVGIGSDTKYQRAYNAKTRSEFWHRTTSKTNYEVEIMLDDLTRDEALEKEKEFIKLYGRRNLGLGTLVNLTDGGLDNKGFVLSDEVRQKMKDASAKRILTPELRAKFATGKGRIKSEEERKKLSDAHKGRPKSEDHKRKLSAYRLGRKASEETKQKISAIHTGRIKSEQECANISAALKGKQKTEEHRRNNALSNYRLSKDQVIHVKNLKASGLSEDKISKIIGCSRGTIHNIVSNKSYKHIAA